MISFFLFFLNSLLFVGWFDDAGYEATTGGFLMMGYDDWVWVLGSGWLYEAWDMKTGFTVNEWSTVTRVSQRQQAFLLSVSRA